MTANEATRPTWPNGVVAQCDECGEIDVLRPWEWDMLGETTVSICRSCYYEMDDR